MQEVDALLDQASTGKGYDHHDVQQAAWIT
jgi:hypothetical protein